MRVKILYPTVRRKNNIDLDTGRTCIFMTSTGKWTTFNNGKYVVNARLFSKFNCTEEMWSKKFLLILSLIEKLRNEDIDTLYVYVQERQDLRNIDDIEENIKSFIGSKPIREYRLANDINERKYHTYIVENEDDFWLQCQEMQGNFNAEPIYERWEKMILNKIN